MMPSLGKLASHKCFTCVRCGALLFLDLSECYFCGFHDGDLYLSWAGLAGTALLLLCMTFVIAFHAKLKKRYREMTDPAYFADVAPPASLRGSQPVRKI